MFRAEAIQPLLGGLAPRGRLSVVGAAQEPILVAPFDLITRRIVITGSAVGGRKLLRETLQFSADFGIKPMIEVHPFER